MANLFNYKNKAEYTAAADRPAQQSSVSYDGAGVISDGKNILLPFNETNCEVGDMVVFDTVENKHKILKSKTYYAGTFDSSRYILGDGVYVGAQNGKGLFVSIRNAVSTSKMWAENCYIRVTGLDLTQAGSFTFNTLYSWAAHNDNVVSWDAGATLASVMATINGLGLSASYFKAAVLADNTGIGIWVNYPGTTVTTNIWSITAKSGGAENAASEWMGKYNRNDVVWQCVVTSTLIPGRTPAKSVIRRNGLSNSWGGGHLAKFIDYHKTNGSATFQAETRVSPMNKACFDGLASSSVEAKLALYNKYGGDYTAYMRGAMANMETANGIIGVSYDDEAYQTKLLAQVLTKDYDKNVIPAFPAAYAAYTYGVNAGVTTGFEAGKWGLPTAWQMMKIISQVGINSSNKTVLNNAMAKFNDAGNFYGNGCFFWTCAERSADSAVIYYGNEGVLSYNNKHGTESCRAVLALNFD
jgi:hypothetical protein